MLKNIPKRKNNIKYCVMFKTYKKAKLKAIIKSNLIYLLITITVVAFILIPVFFVLLLKFIVLPIFVFVLGLMILNKIFC